MEFIRINATDNAYYAESMAHYGHSFPAHEQRSAAAQLAALNDDEYNFTVIAENGRAEGALLYWEADSFIYVEHFYIYPEFRGKGCGSAALEKLCARNKTVILEIDPPVDDVSVRRKGFYERAGFVANAFSHVHPPYHAGNHGHELVIMSSPAAITQAQYDEFAAYLKMRVMGVKA